jgi:hypothetical protein
MNAPAKSVQLKNNKDETQSHEVTKRCSIVAEPLRDFVPSWFNPSVAFPEIRR